MVLGLGCFAGTSRSGLWRRRRGIRRQLLEHTKMDPTALSLRPSLASISLVFIPISPQHIILLFSSVENCLPFIIAMKSCFFFKKTYTGSVCSSRTSGRLSTISEQLIFHHEKAMHNYCTNLSREPLKLFCDPWYICFKYLTFRRQRHKLSAPTVLQKSN